MSVTSPPKDWFQAPTGGERVWIGLALAWCLVLSAVMPYWHFFGKQNSTGESYRVEGTRFVERVEQFVKAGKVGEVRGMPIVEVAPGGDAYLLGRMWQWYPVLKMKQGQQYRLHISSPDLNHGFSLLPMNMNFQVVPGYDHVLTITPTVKGDYTIVCNEFCGIGHHQMTGRIIVE
ncbi:MAG TPA: cytochrome C oxidase subunit II [Pseudomonadota bacterium]|nr:cytochrome C oxidase subunit II [Pseudomonadota bacterium]